MKKELNVAIVGATGLVGRKILEILIERNLKINLHLFAAPGEEFVEVCGVKHKVEQLDLSRLQEHHLDYAFFAVDAEVSKILVPQFTKLGIIVIDNSNAFRRKKNVPLVVTQVNSDALNGKNKIIANPNCSTIQLVTVLKPLDGKFKIKRVVISTYQAVSGAGTNGILDLENGTQSKFDFPIQNNLIPQIDVFLPNGYTREEDKLIFETRKILSRPDLDITATAVRVPVKNGHSESVNIEFEKKTTVRKIMEVLRNANNVVLQDNPAEKLYPMPLYCDGRDEVFVGRIRRDESRENCFNFWIVADNLRRGAASNSVDIFEKLVKMRDH